MKPAAVIKQGYPPWSISIPMTMETEIESLAQKMTAATREIVEKKKLLHIIKNQFLYDEEESQLITAVAASLISGEIAGVPEVQQLPCLDEHVLHAWRSFFSQPPEEFGFESFVMFRLKHYEQILKSYVECAIDEYKMELEYQMFIDHIRCCVDKQPPASDHVTVVYNGDFILFDSMMQPYTKEQIGGLYEKSLLITKEIDLDERVLGPLVALSPERITIYTETFDHALLHTIQNIFEEKISLNHLSSLPKKKKRINIRKKS